MLPNHSGFHYSSTSSSAAGAAGQRFNISRLQFFCQGDVGMPATFGRRRLSTQSIDFVERPNAILPRQFEPKVARGQERQSKIKRTASVMSLPRDPPLPPLPHEQRDA
jgi:hypothetical protein